MFTLPLRLLENPPKHRKIIKNNKTMCTTTATATTTMRMPNTCPNLNLLPFIYAFFTLVVLPLRLCLFSSYYLCMNPAFCWFSFTASFSSSLAWFTLFELLATGYTVLCLLLLNWTIFNAIYTVFCCCCSCNSLVFLQVNKSA